MFRPVSSLAALFAVFLALGIAKGVAEEQDEAPAGTAAEEPAAPPKPRKPNAPAPKPRQAPPKPVAQTPVAPPMAPPAAPVAMPAPAAPAADSTAQLPNGASSIVETYGDWTVNCVIENAAKICVLSQAQGNKETGQRTFAIEVRAPRNGLSDGTVLMPFGLRLESGAVLKLDDKELGQGLRFATCIPQGCLLPFSFPAAATDAMKTAKNLAVISQNLANGQAVTFNISLNGFAAALARSIQLGG